METLEEVKKCLTAAGKQKLLFVIAWKWERCRNSKSGDERTCGDKDFASHWNFKNMCLEISEQFFRNLQRRILLLELKLETIYKLS